MLTIKDDHIDNHFNDNFVYLCHVGYFINGEGDTFYGEGHRS